MDKVKLNGRPPGVVAAWAWEPLLGVPFSVVRARGNAYVIEIDEIEEYLLSLHHPAAREWRMYGKECGRSEVRFPAGLCDPA